MSIYRYGAKVEVIGAKYLLGDNLIAKVKLMEQYDDGTGKVGDILELPFKQLEVDGGLLEFADTCERFTTLKGKELIMKAQLKELEDKPLAELTKYYNSNVAPSKQVKRFADKDAAVARIKRELMGEATKPKKAAKPPATPKAKAAGNGEIKLVGKKSSLAGKYLYKKVDANPRREGTAGWHSWNSLKNGMTYEQFVMAKGGNKHLMWDIAHEYIEVRSKPKA